MPGDEERDTFAEGHPRFEEMLDKGLEFIAYLALWNGYKSDALVKSELGQQDRLGIARAMFRATTLESKDAQLETSDS